MVETTHIDMPDGRLIIRVRGNIDRLTVKDLYESLAKRISDGSKRPVGLDLSEVQRLDSAGVAMLARLQQRSEDKGRALTLDATNENVASSLRLFRLQPLPEPDKKGPSFFVRVADSAIGQWQGLVRFVMLAADCFIWSIGGAARTKRVRKGAMWFEGNRLGVDALPIVGLIAFLIGVVLALQSAYQLRQFGADIYVANLLAVSLTREMGPLMTAIIMAGRSGAAIAAEVATMSVNEEVGALRTMGLEPVRYIVVPKFQAITVVMPSLTMFANVLGLFGGFLVALFYLGLGPGVFFGQVAKALVLKDIVTGLLKSIVFAWIIVLIASHNGFQAYGGAESVGRCTTDSVVGSIFWTIVADAAFNIVFYFG